MRFIDTVKRSGRNLRQARLRTILTASAIAVGGFTLTLTLAAATGARQFTERLIQSNLNPNGVLVAKDAGIFGGSGPGGSGIREYDESLRDFYGQQIKQLDRGDIAKIAALPNVGRIIEEYQTPAQYITAPGAKRYTANLLVYNPVQKPETKAGTAPDELANGSVILSDAYLERLKLGSAEQAVGKTVAVQLRQPSGRTKQLALKIQAVMTKPALALDYTPTNLYISQADARSANDFVNAGTVSQGKLVTVVVIAEGTSAEELKEQIKKAGYHAMTAKDAQKFLYQIVDVLQYTILVFGLITLIASFFGVVNTQYISVLERTREIGLMKALGMSRKGVSALFVIEATWIGFIGAVLGSALAFGVGLALNPWLSKTLEFGDQRLLVFDPLQIAGLVAFLMVVTTIAGLLPARKAARLDPIEALRTE